VAIGRLTEVVVGRFARLKGRMLGLETRMTALEAWSVDTSGRLDRIERRLNLADAP
jgi:hypothetical protein